MVTAPESHAAIGAVASAAASSEGAAADVASEAAVIEDLGEES